MTASETIVVPEDRPLRVVIVCLGNICRSPMAAAVFRSRLDAAGMADDVEVDSAGTGSWHVGQGADKRAGSTLQRHGYDPTHTARQLTRLDLADFDLVLVADRSNLADATELASTPGEAAKVRLLRSLDPDAPSGAEVPDPYYGAGDGFERVLGLIEAAADGFVAQLRPRGTHPG